MSLWKPLCGLAFLLSLTSAVAGAWQGYDLTGTWTDDVGGRYLIRQVGTTVAWFDDRSPVVMNVFSGTISGSTISGQWWDLPGGQLLDSGRLELRIDSNDRLVKTGSSPAYGSSVISRSGTDTSGGGGSGTCTPAGTWSWVDGATAVIRPDGTVGHSAGYTARWQGLGASQYRLTWDNGAVDTLTLSADGRAMDGTNNYGRIVHVTCAGSGGAAGGGGVTCTPAGTWSWVDGATAVIRPDGTVGHSAGYTARWQGLGGSQYRLTWDNGAVDTLTLSADGRAMDGTNNYGRTVHVTCAGSGGGGACSDPRTQAVMDEWLSRASPPENQRPGWSVRYDSWGRLVGQTPTATITGLPQGVDTPMTRCEYLVSIAPSLSSANLGTLQEYLGQRLR